MDSHNTIAERNIIFFDGVCNLCNGAINFIIDLDKNNLYSFSSLQSNFAHHVLSSRDVDSAELKTIILIDNQGNLFKKSDAVLRIITQLGGLWSLFKAFKIVPRFIRDFFYDIIAKNRYTLFGRKDTCRIPTPELQKRFLDAY